MSFKEMPHLFILSFKDEYDIPEEMHRVFLSDILVIKASENEVKYEKYAVAPAIAPNSDDPCESGHAYVYPKVYGDR